MYPPCQAHLKEKSKIKIQKTSTGEESTHTKLTPPTTHHHRGDHHHTHSHTEDTTEAAPSSLLLIDILFTTHYNHTPTLYPKLKISRDFSKPLKKLIMNQLFSLLLVLMSGTCAIQMLASVTTDDYILSITGFVLSFTCMVVNIISPLFNSKS